MKLHTRTTRLVALTFVSLFFFILVQPVQAQPDAPTTSPLIAPSSKTPVEKQSNLAARGAKESIDTPREQRQQAYAKLLEGQRYYDLARGNRDDKEALRLAQQAFRQAAALDPTLAEAHTALAEIAFFALQDLEQATREAELAIGINSSNFGAHRLLARIYSLKSGLKEGNLNKPLVERAITELLEVVRLYPPDAESWALLGEFYLASGKSDAAIDAFQHWAAASPATDQRIFQFITNGRELTPDAASARLAEALMSAGRNAEAVAAARRAITLNPENREYLILLSQAFEAGGSRDKSALEDLQRVYDSDPTNFVALQLLARAKARTGQVDEAVKLLRSKLNGSLEDFNLYLIISLLYTQAGRANDAVTSARKALALAPADRQDLATQALVVLSSAQERAGDAKGSEESLRKVLTREPNNATALNNLGYFLVERNERLNEALEMIQRAVRAEPTNPSFLDSLGWAYFKLGQFVEAERHLTEAARRDTTSATIQEHLGDLYRQQGKLELARAAWQKALSLSTEASGTARIKAKLNPEIQK
ncbi:MAG TPA: tetratricopeptide repeat protein [Pyrinomonadaceae bacterium]